MHTKTHDPKQGKLTRLFLNPIKITIIFYYCCSFPISRLIFSCSKLEILFFHGNFRFLQLERVASVSRSYLFYSGSDKRSFDDLARFPLYCTRLYSLLVFQPLQEVSEQIGTMRNYGGISEKRSHKISSSWQESQLQATVIL